MKPLLLVEIARLCGAGLLAMLTTFPLPATAETETPSTYSIRVAHWNIGHFAMGKANSPTVSAEASPARAAEYRAMVASLDVDILGISEYDPVFDLAGTPTTNALFSAYPSQEEGPKREYQCNAVFMRFPVVRREIVDYRNRYQKTYFLDTVFLIGTNEVHFVQTHLDWNSNEKATDARPRQIRQLIDHFRDEPYVVLSGDWNVYGAGEYYPFLMAGYSLANCGEAGCLHTCAGFNKRMPCVQRCLDNIVAKGFRVRDVYLADKDYLLSDHRIIGCTLEMK